MIAPRRLPILAAAAVAAMTLAGCTSASLKRGDELFRTGDYEAAAAAYREALIEDPDDDRITDALERAEQRAADARVDAAVAKLKAGDLPGAVAEYEEALKVEPRNQAAQDALGRERPRLEAVRRAIASGQESLGKGDPIEAERTLRSVLAWRAGFPDLAATYDKARRGAAAALRDKASKRLSIGDVQGANADLAEAKRLEAGAAAPPAGDPGSAASATRGAREEPAALVGAGALDAYAEAAAEVTRLTEGRPKRRGEGIPKPEDYAIPEEKIPDLRAAIEKALSVKPPGERQPAWLAHGRLVLQMSVEAAASKRIVAAKASLERGAIVKAWHELEEARVLDREGNVFPHYAETAQLVRMATAKLLLEEADRAIADGLFHLAKLRARQATEVDPAAGAAASEVVALAEARGGVPSIALLPFQNYSGRAGLEERLYLRILRRLEGTGTAGVLSFEAYRRKKEAGRLPPLTAIAKGDVTRFETRDAGDDDAAIRARILTLTEKARGARRRVLEAPDAESRRRAEADLEQAERLLARAERERASSLFASTGGHMRPVGTSQQEDRPVALTVEFRVQLHDPRAGRDFYSEPIVRAVEGSARDEKALEDRLLDDLAEPIVAAIKDRLKTAATARRDPAGLDPRAALDARIADAEQGRGSVDTVLEATGYSFAEKRTVPLRLRVE